MLIHSHTGQSIVVTVLLCCPHANVRHIWILIHSSYGVAPFFDRLNLIVRWQRKRILQLNAFASDFAYHLTHHTETQSTLPFVPAPIPSKIKHGQRVSIGLRTMCDRNDKNVSSSTWRSAVIRNSRGDGYVCSRSTHKSHSKKEQANTTRFRFIRSQVENIRNEKKTTIASLKRTLTLRSSLINWFP